MLIATIPGPQNTNLLEEIVGNPFVNTYRFNTGVRVPFSPLETLSRLLDFTGPNLWIDLKCRQLRIIKWAYPGYGAILLSRNINLELPAHVHFRGEDFSCDITDYNQNEIFIYPNPRHALGAGQSINIHAQKLNIEGFLTEEDIAYIEAAKTLGLNQFMLSFVEFPEDISSFRQLCPEAKIYLKIESPKGIEFVKKEFILDQNTHLMAARDDLFVNLNNKPDIISASQLIVSKDPEAVVASRLLNSLTHSDQISLGDFSDLYLLDLMGYQNFMFCDSISSRSEIFQNAISAWKEFQLKKERM